MLLSNLRFETNEQRVPQFVITSLNVSWYAFPSATVFSVQQSAVHQLRSTRNSTMASVSNYRCALVKIAWDPVKMLTLNLCASIHLHSNSGACELDNENKLESQNDDEVVHLLNDSCGIAIAIHLLESSTLFHRALTDLSFLSGWFTRLIWIFGTRRCFFLRFLAVASRRFQVYTTHGDLKHSMEIAVTHFYKN